MAAAVSGDHLRNAAACGSMWLRCEWGQLAGARLEKSAADRAARGHDALRNLDEPGNGARGHLIGEA